MGPESPDCNTYSETICPNFLETVFTVTIDRLRNLPYYEHSVCRPTLIYTSQLCVASPSCPLSLFSGHSTTLSQFLTIPPFKKPIPLILMNSPAAPIEFRRSYFGYESYPLNLPRSATRVTAATLSKYKARLDNIAADLCLEDETDVDLPIRDLYGNTTTGKGN